MFNTKTLNGQTINPGDVTINLDGITYSLAIIADPDSDNISAIINRNFEAVYSLDDESAALLACYAEGSTYNAANAAMLAAAITFNAEPLRAAARAYQVRYAGKLAITDGMTHADIAAAKKDTAREKSERRAARRESKAQKALASGEKTTVFAPAKWYTCTFDVEAQLIRLSFDRYPGRYVTALCKDNGFAWIATAGEWRRGYNAKAKAAAQTIMTALPRYKKDLPRA